MKANYEIYSIGYNRRVDREGVSRVDGYTVGTMHPELFKIPVEIKIKGELIIVTFNDNSRHIIPLSVGVEIMDRPVETKTKANDRNTKDRTDKETT